MSLPFLQSYLGLSAGLNTMQGGSVGGWVELGRTTLGSPATTFGVNGLTDKRYYMVLIYHLGRSAASSNDAWQPSSSSTYDTGSNMSNRYSLDGGADATATSQSAPIFGSTGGTTPRFAVGYWANYSTKEKLMQFWDNQQLTAGATTAPRRNEIIGKHAQTSNPWDGMRLNTTNAETYNTGSEMVVLGWDPADTHTTNFWTELASVSGTGSSTTLSTGTMTAKKYLWVQAYCSGGHAGGEDIQMTFNNDTTAKYAYRRSINGGADATGTSQSNLSNPMAGDGIKSFMNMFIINNSANEKLCINHLVEQNTAGAANAPNRREHAFKWANTSAQITEIDLTFSGSTNWGTGSIMKVWGSD